MPRIWPRSIVMQMWVMVFFAGADALRFVKQYADYGLKKKIPLVGKGYLVDDKILQKQGSAAEGVVTESHWCLLLDNPENKKFTEAYTKKYGHPRRCTPSRDISRPN